MGVTGAPPAYDTPDEDVYLPGRNIVLLAKAGVYCAGRGHDRAGVGTLADNPFPDATPEFFAAIRRPCRSAWRIPSRWKRRSRAKRRTR